MKNKKIIIAAIAALAIIVVVISLRSSGKEEAQKTQPALLSRHVAAEGKVEALPGRQIEIGSELIARIDKSLVKVGDEVKKDDVLVMLDSRDISARLLEAEKELLVAKARYDEIASGARKEEKLSAIAALDAANAQAKLAWQSLDRHKELYAKGMIPKSSLEEKESAYKVARARAREAEQQKTIIIKGPKEETLKLQRETVSRAQASVSTYRNLLDKTVIRAPFGGKVIRKHLEEGETVIPETPIMTIADTSSIRVNAEVDETDSGRIHLGDTTEISSDAYPGIKYAGVVEEIADMVGERKITPNNTAKNIDMKVLSVKVAFRGATPLKIGMTVDVRIIPATEAGAKAQNHRMKQDEAAARKSGQAKK